MTTIVVPSSCRMPSSSSPSASLSAWAMPADGSSSSSTRGCERQQAGDLDDPPGAGGELGDHLVRVRRETHPLHQLVGLGGLGAVGLRGSDGGDPQAGRVGPLAGDHQGLADGQRREQRGVLERPDQARPGPLLGGGPREVGAVEHDLAACPGVVNPATISKTVVLPAPLGPITPRISPRRTSKSTPSTATTPPKCRARSVTTRAGASARVSTRPVRDQPVQPGAARAAARSAARRRRRAPRPGRCRAGARPGPPSESRALDEDAAEPVGEEHHDEQPAHRERGLARQPEADQAGEPDQEQGADHRAGGDAETADHGERDDVDAGRGRERVDGERGLAVPDHDAAEAGQRAGDGVELQLAAPVRDGERAGRVLVVAQRLQRQAEPAAPQVAGHPEAEREHEQREQVVVLGEVERVAEPGRLRRVDAVAEEDVQAQQPGGGRQREGQRARPRARGPAGAGPGCRRASRPGPRRRCRRSPR